MIKKPTPPPLRRIEAPGFGLPLIAWVRAWLARRHQRLLRDRYRTLQAFMVDDGAYRDRWRAIGRLWIDGGCASDVPWLARHGYVACKDRLLVDGNRMCLLTDKGFEAYLQLLLEVGGDG